MKFDVSSKMKSLVTVLDTLPQKFKKYELPGSKAEYTEGPFGSFIWQYITTEYYTVSQQQFFVDKSIRLYPFTNRPTVALNCMLRGSLNCILQGVGRVPLIENKYALYYLPAEVKHIAYFTKGYYETIDFELEEAYLRFFVKDHPALTALHDALLRSDENGQQLNFCDININVRELITKIRDANADVQGHRIYVQTRINDIMLLYLQELQSNISDVKKNPERRHLQIKDISNYIKNNIGNRPSVTTLADLSNVHVSTLQKEFKKQTGVTLQDYINDQRMEFAVSLLLHSPSSLSEIGETVGYSDASSFTKAFKARFGITPGEFRKNGKAE